MSERNRKTLEEAAKIVGHAYFRSDDSLISRGLQWLSERGTVEINHHPEGFSLSCNSKTGASGASFVEKFLGDAVASCIINVHFDEVENEPTKPCVVCKKRLDPVNGDWDKYQPYQGCELKIIGSYGTDVSAFDKNGPGPTIYRGVICDDCALNFVGWMEEVK